ncbi:MAG: hypothetical protein K0U61_01065, partial [Alphaproteobacteria bacterium]|nr:hypothetical protein [Alphaproteobacteria bacterium]
MSSTTDPKTKSAPNAGTPKEPGKFKRRISALLVAVVFGLFSLVTTGMGIGSLFPDMELMFAMALGMAASLVISTAVFRFYTAWFLQEYSSRGTLALIIACCFMATSTSAVLASGTISFKANEAAYQIERQAGPVAEMTKPLIEVRDSALENASYLDTFSNRSTRKSERETSHGDTCDGQSTDNVCGVRCRMRQRLSNEASGYAISARAVADEAVLVTSSASTIASDEQWRELYRNATALTSDQRIVEIATWAENTLDDFQNGFTDEQTGSDFVCRDATTEAELAGLIDLLNRPVSVGSVPVARPIADFTFAVSKNLEALTGFFLYSLGVVDDYDRAGAARMLAPLLFAFLVEGFIILSIYLSWYKEDRVK